MAAVCLCFVPAQPLDDGAPCADEDADPSTCDGAGGSADDVKFDTIVGQLENIIMGL